MGLFTKDIKTFDDLFAHQLEDIYYAEQQILKTLPDMVSKAKSPDLKAAFQAHLGETKNHVQRLEQAFKTLGRDPKGATCPAIDGIIKEAKEVAGDIDNQEVLDAALLASAQAVEHYEMTRYGTLIAWAERLGKTNVVTFFQQNLEDEKKADAKLTSIATSSVNKKAA